MRGTHVGHAEVHERLGIIPAYAGNTRGLGANHPVTRDHPRVCGEHIVVGAHRCEIQGSSPRMRGTPWPTRRYRNACQDHPRVCGEHHMTSIMVHLNWGSSPRMRGTPGEQIMQIVVIGIIPAYAGNTFANCRVIGMIRDHPRVCGEHGRVVTVNGNVKGSSPRMRGTPKWMVLHVLPYGIIPAYAGNTYSGCAAFTSKRDHPRVCGEHSHQ